MSQKNREPGFYWVLPFGFEWTVAEYTGHIWMSARVFTALTDLDMEEIDERRITREEQKS